MTTRKAAAADNKSIKVMLNQSTATPEKPAEYDPKLGQMMEIMMNSQNEIKEHLGLLRQEMTEIKKEMTQFKKIDDTLKQIKSTLNENAEHINEVEDKLETLKDQFTNQMDGMAMLELRQKETFLRIRGLPEEEKENLLERLLPMLSQIWNMEEGTAAREIDRLYRANSKIARDKKLPRDIVIKFVRKNLRDQILYNHSKSKLCIDGNPLIILKEIPTAIRRKRKDYMGLADTLRMNNIRFRWNLPEGLSFSFEERNYNINNVPKAQEFLSKNKISLKLV
ncbi:uncharacterized protein LOC125431645 [Sphaerodactylus townsendi]|uniref:uncharacterized protein LOC125430546 n=1 Tax=Sphaerodactylus townsendi TaxID=933632 RepID=UPI0020275581|nr:uncharacterized protein LOC125430546 [Sphaerodactylus townsendi]XP_048350594.1 uncharacterized protein LOC125431645 [Sphaerodactylus townsendi]